MHPTLLLLSKLRLKGQWRQLKRTLASPKGIVLALVTLAFFAPMLLPFVAMRAAPPDAKALTSWLLHPGLLFVLWVVSVIGGSVKNPIAFSMAEVDFLFPGPFTRRQLLTHKLAISLLGPLGFAVMMFLFLPWAWWLAVLVGVWLIGAFVQWSGVATAMAVNMLGTRFRLLLILAVVAIVAAGAASFQMAGVFTPGLDLPERLAALESSTFAKLVFAPFVVFNRLILAESYAALAGYGFAAVAMIAALAGLIVLMDDNFLEASLAASRQRYEALERMKRSGGPVLATASTPRLKVPPFPRWQGAGPIAWRQTLHMLRSSSILLVAVPALVGIVVTIGVVAGKEEPPAAFLVFMILMIGFLIAAVLPLGLRNDLDHIDTINGLPIGPTAVVWGSIGSAITYIALVQLVAAAAVAAALRHWMPANWLAIGLAVPIDVLLVGFDSILVLLFPAIRRFNPTDPLSGARMMLINTAKVLFVVAAAGVALVAVLIVRWLAGSVPLLLALVGCGVMFVEGLATVWVAAQLFRRYDASAHASESN